MRSIFAVLTAAAVSVALMSTNVLAGGTGGSVNFGNEVNTFAALVVTNGGGKQPAYQRLEAVRSISWSQASGKVTIKGGPLARTRKGDYRWLAPLIESATGMEDGRATKGASDSENQRWPISFKLTRGRVIESYSCDDNPYGVEPSLLAKSYDTAGQTSFCG